MHGWRDFLLHLLTITIGLLIALSLEGCVEWQHHRHLVHEAEASLHAEIKSNADGLHAVAADIKKQQNTLNHDIVVLKAIIKDGKAPPDDHMEIAFHIAGFDNVSWKTAQSTGSLSFMPYAEAEEYASIYDLQDQLDMAQKQAARDAILSLGPFVNMPKGEKPNPAEAASVMEHIEVLQGQLLLVDSLVKGLDGEYKKFLASHP